MSTTESTNLTPTGRIKKQYKPRGKTSLKSKRLLKLQLTHGDANGLVDLKALDSTQPGWDKGMYPRGRMSMEMSKNRRKGVFAYYKAHPELLADVKTVAEKKAANNNGSHTPAAPAMPGDHHFVDADAQDKEINRQVELRVAAVFGNLQGCPRCRLNLGPYLSAAKLVANGKA